MPSSMDFGRRDNSTMTVMITAAATAAPTIQANVDHCTEVWRRFGCGYQQLHTHLLLSSRVGSYGPAHLVAPALNGARRRRPDGCTSRPQALPPSHDSALPDRDRRLYGIDATASSVESLRPVRSRNRDDDRDIGRQPAGPCGAAGRRGLNTAIAPAAPRLSTSIICRPRHRRRPRTPGT